MTAGLPRSRGLGRPLFASLPRYMRLARQLAALCWLAGLPHFTNRALLARNRTHPSVRMYIEVLSNCDSICPSACDVLLRGRGKGGRQEGRKGRTYVRTYVRTYMHHQIVTHSIVVLRVVTYVFVCA